MDSKHIEALLEKYWNCETSLEEEQQLRTYFKENNAPGNEAALFRYFEHERGKQIQDKAFDKTLTAKLSSPGKARTIRLVYNVMRIAAGLIVVVAATYFVRQEVKKNNPAEDTFTDPKIAFEETKKALMMISKGFGKGQKEVNKINVFNQAEDKVEGKTKKKNDSSI